jgi:hypothetical protein
MDGRERIIKMNNINNAWIEWKKVCDLAKCSKETKMILNDYADSILRKSIHKISYSSLFAENFLKGSAFTYFEMYSLSKTYSQKEDEFKGKSYKDGIFLKTASSQDSSEKIINGCFNLYLKAAIREMYKDELEEHDNEISADQPLKNQEDSTLLDLLPDAVEIESAFEDEELLYLAEKCKSELFNALSFQDKAILLSVFLGISYSTSKALQKATDLSKSTLGYHFQKLFKEKKYAYAIRNIYPNERQENTEIIYGYAMILLKDEIFSWGNSEKRCEPLFIEGGRSGAFFDGGKKK